MKILTDDQAEVMDRVNCAGYKGVNVCGRHTVVFRQLGFVL